MVGAQHALHDSYATIHGPAICLSIPEHLESDQPPLRVGEHPKGQASRNVRIFLPPSDSLS